MSGWIYPVIGLAIVSALLALTWMAERHESRTWWREPKAGDYLDLRRPRYIGRKRWE